MKSVVFNVLPSLRFNINDKNIYECVDLCVYASEMYSRKPSHIHLDMTDWGRNCVQSTTIQETSKCSSQSILTHERTQSRHCRPRAPKALKQWGKNETHTHAHIHAANQVIKIEMFNVQCDGIETRKTIFYISIKKIGPALEIPSHSLLCTVQCASK